LKHYAKRVWDIIDSFNSFNITFVPQEKNKKTDSLAVATSLFNTDDSQNPNTFHVKTIFQPSIPDNQEYWKVFENDEHIANFLAYLESTSFDISKEIQSNQKEIHDHNITVLPKNYVSLESLFTRDDQTKTMNTVEESSLRKVQETHKINIGTFDVPKCINLGTSCTTEEVEQYTLLFKSFKMFLHGVMMI
jgi:hypothetical protein